MSEVNLTPVNNPCWFAIWTRSRHEKYVRDQLVGQGIEPLLPLVRRQIQWKDRKKAVDIPLFPGYCFARFGWEGSSTVLRTRGVVRVIGGSGRPEPIPDYEIDAIKKLMAHTLPFDSHPYLQKGMRVRIIRGPLEGVKGILSRKDKLIRVVIAVHLLQQAAMVEMDLADLAPE